MTIMTDDRRVRATVASPARYFYFHMALACAAVAFLGFAPTYFVPMARGSLAIPPVLHIHGIVFFASKISLTTSNRNNTDDFTAQFIGALCFLSNSSDNEPDPAFCDALIDN